MTRRTTRRGWVRVQLGKGHPYANSGGWQWEHRLVAMEQLGRVLRTDEHVHHKDLDRANNRPENLEVRAAAYHGRLHASWVILSGHTWERDSCGRFTGRLVELDNPVGPVQAPRFAWMIHERARELVCAS